MYGTPRPAGPSGESRIDGFGGGAVANSTGAWVSLSTVMRAAFFALAYYLGAKAGLDMDILAKLIPISASASGVLGGRVVSNITRGLVKCAITWRSSSIELESAQWTSSR